MSAGELFDLLRPVVVVVSALLATWLLISARRRFPSYQALVLAITSFFLPFILVPLYLAWLLVWQRPATRAVKWRVTLPLLFLALILSTAGLYTYVDEHTVDAHLASALQAKVNLNPMKAIAEYREALKLEDNPHTHKLLAETLDDTGLLTEAITEFKTAEQGGEPDDSIHLRLGYLLERIDHPGEAVLEYKKFVESKSCEQPSPPCESAKQRIVDLGR